MGGEGNWKQISLACVESARTLHTCVWTTLGLPKLKAVCASVSTLFKLQYTLQGHCPKQALCFMHFPGLSLSGSQILHKGTDSVGHVFCALFRSDKVLSECTVPGGPCILTTSLVLAVGFLGVL